MSLKEYWLVMAMVGFIVGLFVFQYYQLQDICTSIETTNMKVVQSLNNMTKLYGGIPQDEYKPDVGMCISSIFVNAMS